MPCQIFVDRKLAESSFYNLYDSLLSQHPECDFDFGYIDEYRYGRTMSYGNGRFQVLVDNIGLFPNDRKGRPTSKIVDGVLYARCVETIIHEFAHVDQMSHPSSVAIQLVDAVSRCNPGLANDRYSYDLMELDAERQGVKELYPHLCKTFGKELGRQVFDGYVRSYIVSGRGNHNMVLDMSYNRPEDIFNTFDRVCKEALDKPYWYRFRSAYDKGINSKDMVLRVLSDKKWEGAEAIIQKSSGLEQSCRCILALCAEEDPHVLDGLEDLHISVESEFPSGFSKNEYEQMRNFCDDKLCLGHPTVCCRIAVLDAKPTSSGETVSVRAVQACDLKGKNCPVSPEPDLCSFDYKGKDGKTYKGHHLLYPVEDYDKMKSAFNTKGDCPVFYSDLKLRKLTSGEPALWVDPGRVRLTDVPFSLEKHNQNVAEARQAVKERADAGAGRQVLCKPYIPPPDLPPIWSEENHETQDSLDDGISF